MADPQSIQESQNLSMFLANHNRITQVMASPPPNPTCCVSPGPASQDPCQSQEIGVGA